MLEAPGEVLFSGGGMLDPTGGTQFPLEHVCRGHSISHSLLRTNKFLRAPFSGSVCFKGLGLSVFGSVFFPGLSS